MEDSNTQPQEIKRILRLEVQRAWDEFTISRQASLAGDESAAIDGNGFWHYQQAVRQLSSLVRYGRVTD